MFVVRMVLGDADRTTSEYTTFETAQMAALIQMSKLSDAEKELPSQTKKAEVLLEQKAGWSAMGAELGRRKPRPRSGIASGRFSRSSNVPANLPTTRTAPAM